RVHPTLPILLLGVGGLSAEAVAAPTVEFELVGDCDQESDNCGPKGENDGPGFEQASTTFWTNAAGKTWVATVAMSAKDIPDRGEAPYQCRYYAWEIDPMEGPVRKVDGLLLTDNEGDRP